MTLCTDLPSSLSTFLSLRNLGKTLRQFNTKLIRNCHFLKTVFIEPACPGLVFLAQPCQHRAVPLQGSIGPSITPTSGPKIFGCRGLEWHPVFSLLGVQGLPQPTAKTKSGRFSPAQAQVATSHREQPCRSCKGQHRPHSQPQVPAAALTPAWVILVIAVSHPFR